MSIIGKVNNMAQDAMQSMMGNVPMGVVPEPTQQETMAFEQALPQINPTELSDEILNASADIDLAEVQELRQLIAQAQLPAEIVEAMLDIAEMALADPDNYGMMRQELIKEGAPEELLPVQFDAEYFGALELALQQAPSMRTPMGMEPIGLADGGIVSLKPIAKELQRHGRYGDTILAHITPAEARMLKRNGGSGTTNPVTGLPEFNLFKKAANAFKSVGKAVVGAVKSVAKGVQKFAKSPIGKIAIAATLFYFAGPLAAQMGMSAVGAAAFKGAVAGFGSSILGGDNFKTALRNGAIGGVVAGAGAGIMGGAEAFQAGSYTGPATYGEQFQQLKQGVGSLFGGDTAAQAMPVQPPGAIPATSLDPLAAPSTPALGGTTSAGLNIPVPSAPSVGDPSLTIAGNMPATGGGGSGAGGSFLDRLTGGIKGLFPGGSSGADPQDIALKAVQSLPPGTPDAIKTLTFENALKQATPSALAKYGPYVAGGLGIMGLTGGFNSQEQEPSGIVSGQPTGMDLLQQQPEQYGVNLGPVNTVYAPPAPPVTDAYQDYYELMANNPFMPQNQTRMLAQGGPANPDEFPRKNGPINGPGTGTSDSIPAMLSDGEFVFTARAVRGAGNGSRRDGAKRMYQMMKQFERNS
jgi:hypothetical protein